MTWNWQDPDWPNFRWAAERIAAYELEFAQKVGVLIGSSRHLVSADRSQLVVELMSRSALDSSAIEDEILDRDSVQSSVRRQLGLQADHKRVGAAEAGIATLMVDLFETLSEPLDHAKLFHWHRLVMAGNADLQVVGGYRVHEEPMQIVSGPDYRRKVHFEAPPSATVATEMDRFLRWFTDSAPSGSAPLSPVARAGIAHLWFETIHPFEDGNGRLGRVIAEKALSQGRDRAMLTGISSSFMQNRSRYYAQLEAASRGLDIDKWLAWFAQMTLAAQDQTVAWVSFVIGKAQLLSRLEGQINMRQEKVLIRLFKAGPEGFIGGLSADNYRTISGATSATATRDLADLVERGALRRTGERKGTRYWLTLT